MARRLDEYKPLEFYAEHSKARQSGFAKFDVDGDYYFCRYVDGQIALLSQSYVAAAGRDNGIDSVKRNEKTKSRYRFEEREDGFGFGLRAGNGQEIGVSPTVATMEEAEYISGRIRGAVKKKATTAKTTTTKAKPKKAKAATAAVAAGAAAKAASKGRSGDYKPLAHYIDHGGDTADGFDRFDHDGGYFFSYRKGGYVRLISESYTTARARENGIASVEKNMPNADRYKYRTHDNGKHYFDLFAGNHQEIATSPWYDDADAAMAAAADLRGETVSAKGGADHDNYQPLAFYVAGSTATEDGFDTFTGEDGLHYFVYRQDGDIELVSEGYPTTAARDRGMASVEKNMSIQERYDDSQGGLGGETGYRLKAGNNREIARSVPHGSSAAAMAAATMLLGGGAALAASATAKAVPAPEPEEPVDDYLSCDNYEGHPITDADNRVAEFQHDNGRFYFAFYDADGDVRWRSEGFETEAARAEELAIALRVHDNDDFIKRMEKGDRYIEMLHDETGREVARSCLCTVAAAPIAAVAPVTAAAATAVPAAAAATAPAAAASGGGAGIWGWLKLLLLALLILLALWLLSRCMGGDRVTPTPPPVTPDPVACWNGTEAATEADCPARIACADGSFATAESLCPPVMVDCPDGSTAATLDACPPEPAPAVEPIPAPTPPPQVTCWDGSLANTRGDCPARPAPRVDPVSTGIGGSAAVLGFFDGPGDLEAKTVRRLGTFPEFGDSHDLDPAGFYAKLSSRYDTVDYDRIYLDNLFRALGYEGGFRDARVGSALFSNAVIDQGTLGILGFGEFHGIEYVNLDPISDRDLQAFQIMGADGTIVYFMKTCGNYFYPVEL